MTSEVVAARGVDRARILAWLRDYGVYAAIVLLVAVDTVLNPSFIAAGDLRVQAFQLVPTLFVSRSFSERLLPKSHQDVIFGRDRQRQASAHPNRHTVMARGSYRSENQPLPDAPRIVNKSAPSRLGQLRCALDRHAQCGTSCR